MDKRIIRVFPYRTAYTPADPYAFVGFPTFLIPEHDEVHVCCTFSWDRAECERLAYQWEGFTNKPVKLGGVAYQSPAEEFVPGMYVRKGITFTSRGCNNNCPFCIVPKQEGRLRELPIAAGNIVQDNNILQCSKAHQAKVFEMLKTQKAIEFRGGLEAELITDEFVEMLRGISLHRIHLACDSEADIPAFKRAMAKLRPYFSRDKISCYCLSCGKDMEKDTARAKMIFEEGAMPFVQLYQRPGATKTSYSREWRDFQREWSRPMIIKANMKKEGVK